MPVVSVATRMWFLCATLLLPFVVALPLRAQVAQPLDAEFDARIYSTAEKRILQLGLAIEGKYVGLLDGMWGQASQQAIERFANAADPSSRPNGLVLGHNTADLARRATSFVLANDLAYRSAMRGHFLLLPPSRFEFDWSNDMDDRVAIARGLEVRQIDGGRYFAGGPCRSRMPL
jgi:hypothetical protein